MAVIARSGFQNMPEFQKPFSRKAGQPEHGPRLASLPIVQPEEAAGPLPSGKSPGPEGKPV